MLKRFFSLIIVLFLTLLVGCDYLPLPTDETSESTEVGGEIQDDDSVLTFNDYLEHFNYDSVIELLPDSFHDEDLVERTKSQGSDSSIMGIRPRNYDNFAIDHNTFIKGSHLYDFTNEGTIEPSDLTGIGCCKLGGNRVYQEGPLYTIYSNLERVIAVMHLVDQINEQLLVSDYISFDEQTISIGQLEGGRIDLGLIRLLGDIKITVDTTEDEITVYYETSAREEEVDDRKASPYIDEPTDLEMINESKVNIQVTMSRYSNEQFKTTIISHFEDHDETNFLINDTEEVVETNPVDMSMGIYIELIDGESLLVNTNYLRVMKRIVNQEYGDSLFSDAYTLNSMADVSLEINNTETDTTINYKLINEYNTDANEGYHYIPDQTTEQQIHASGNDQSGYIVAKHDQNTEAFGTNGSQSDAIRMPETAVINRVELYDEDNNLLYTHFKESNEGELNDAGEMMVSTNSGYLIDMRLLSGWTRAKFEEIMGLTIYNDNTIVYHNSDEINQGMEKMGIRFIDGDNSDTNKGIFFHFKENTLNNLEIPEEFLLEQENKINFVTDQLGQLKEIDLSDDRYQVPELASDSE